MIIINIIALLMYWKKTVKRKLRQPFETHGFTLFPFCKPLLPCWLIQVYAYCLARITLLMSPSVFEKKLRILSTPLPKPLTTMYPKLFSKIHSPGFGPIPTGRNTPVNYLINHPLKNLVFSNPTSIFMQRSEVTYVGYQPHQRAHKFLHTGRTLGTATQVP